MGTIEFRLGLQEQSITQLFGGMFVTSNYRWDVSGGSLKQHPQQPGSLAYSWRCGEESQAAAPEGQASKDTKGSVGLGVAQGSRARHGVMICNCGLGSGNRVVMKFEEGNAISDR